MTAVDKLIVFLLIVGCFGFGYGVVDTIAALKPRAQAYDLTRCQDGYQAACRRLIVAEQAK